LIGLDPELLLDRAGWMMRQCAADVSGARNPGLVLGAVLAQAVADGRDKLTFLADDSVAPLGAWLEQLIAESSGKGGKGIVVVDGEPLAGPDAYGNDRLFVYLRREGVLDGQVAQLADAGHPVLTFDIPEAHDLGAEFYRWQVATAMACAELRVNAFDQPDVQDNKSRTVKKIGAYSQTGKLEEGQPLWERDGVRAYSTLKLTGKGLKKTLVGLLAAAGKGDYVASMLPTEERGHDRRPDRAAPGRPSEDRLCHDGRLRAALPAQHRPASQGRSGLGRLPADHGRTGRGPGDPGRGMTFGVLERCQALGDYEALQARGRRILRIHLPSPEAIKSIVNELGNG